LAAVSPHDIAVFVIVVGAGSTLVLDLWVTALRAFRGWPATDWGKVGRWLMGVPSGQLVLDQENEAEPAGIERIVGWTFHYAIGLAYAALLPLVWGAAFVAHPGLVPIVLVGLVLSTLAGLCLLMPAMGAGFMASRVPERGRRIALLIVAHCVFAGAQFAWAWLLVPLR